MTETNNDKRSVFVLGGSGEVGKELVKALVSSEKIGSIRLIGRRTIELPQTPEYEKVEQKQVDFDNIQQHEDAFKDTDIGFCCLGTTRAKAGAEGFVKVDHDYVLNSAKVAKDQGTQSFHLVSSTGANSNSWFLYPKTKGEVEDHMKEVGFKSLYIYRPAALICDRNEKRTGERFAQRMLSTFDKSNKMSTSTDVVARCMLKNALQQSAEAVTLKTHQDIVKECVAE